MNADDRGMNLAEKRTEPAHGGYPGVPVKVTSVPDPGLPSVDWESAAGRAFQEAHTARRELAHLRRWLEDYAPLVLREYNASV